MGNLDPAWAFWVAENLERGCQPQDLIARLINSGHSEDVARQAVHNAVSSPERGTSLRRLHRREWVLDTMRHLAEMSTSMYEVERVRTPSAQEFLDRYYAAYRPVIILDGISDWKALERWPNLKYLRDAVGEATVEVQAERDRDPKYEMNFQQHKKKMPFSQFVDLVEQGTGNDYYMTANNSAMNQTALRPLRADYEPPSTYLDMTRPHADGHLWFGPAGTVTNLHHDLTNNMMAQVCGRKLIRLVPPYYSPYVYNTDYVYSDVDLDNVDYERWPLFRKVKWLELTLHPGEMLFLPVGWWHYVRSLDVSITIAFTNFHWDNRFFIEKYEHRHQ